MNIRSTVPGLAALCIAAACTMTPSVPDALKPGPDAKLAMVVPAKGVQIYECRARKGAADAYEWAFVAPEAELYDMRGNLIGRHGAGPSWQAADGSRVVGSVKARADAPTADSIPWLLLATTDSGPAGRFSGVTSIQRVNTSGGTPPTKPCGPETLGMKAGIHYSADYNFFTSTPTLTSKR
jgi:hypothetical protein